MKHVDYFKTTRLDEDLRGHALKGGVLSISGQAVKFLVRLGATVVLARLLTPQDFGLVVMVVAVTGVFLIFKDLGLATATVQKSEINHQQVSTLFWINVAGGLVLMAVVAGLSFLITWFYDEQRLFTICLALSSVFGLSGLSVQHEALLRRQMYFGRLALVEVISALLGAIVAIVVALHHGTFWALVFQQITMAALATVGMWVACSWRPGWSHKNCGVSSFLSFGGNLSAFHLVNYLARNMDRILIGKFWGTNPLGLYNKSTELVNLPLMQIIFPVSQVATPTLSRLQGEEMRFRHYYLQAIFLVSSVTLPLLALLIVMSEEIIAIVLGPQWVGAVQIFRILAVGAVVQPILSSCGWLFVASGQTRRLLKWGIFASSVIIIAFLIGLPYGTEGVAIGYSLALLLLVGPCLAYATHKTAIKIRDVLGAVFYPLLATIIATGSGVYLKYCLMSESGLWQVLLAGSLTMGVLYCLLLLFAFGKKKLYLEVIRGILGRPEE